jgi:tetratricopeptide (TPR) repeat protein
VAKTLPISRLLRSLIVLAGAAALITGCATSNPGPQTDEAFTQSMSEAEAAAKGGQQDKAIDLYQQIAKQNPTRDEPWVRIAQLQFGSEKYPQAILAAEEALQRDNADRQAKSILAVSGLRVARRSLQELRADSALAGDVKTDAQVLAKMLRDTLGEQVLFPAEQPARPPVKRRVTRRAAPAAEAANHGSAAPAAATGAASGGNDPFGALR